MARRRYLSTDISTDAKLANISRLAVILYTWGIPHAADDCRLNAKNAAECRWSIIPNQECTIKEVEESILELLKVKLWEVDENGHFSYPPDSFYKYQTYISSAKQRKTPQNTVSSSLSSSLSSSKTKKKIRVAPPKEALELAQLLSDKIFENIPNRTPPTEHQLLTWAYEADRIHHIDGHPWDEIRKLLLWSQQDDFWKSNILSMSKLRKQWNQLMAKATGMGQGKADRLRQQTARALKQGIR